jgi:hypothetical protein
MMFMLHQLVVFRYFRIPLRTVLAATGRRYGWHLVRHNSNSWRCMTLFLLREIVELPSGGGKRVFDCHLKMFVSAVVRRRVIDYNVLVRRNRKRNVDTESTAVTVFVTGCNYSNVASNDVAIVLF